MHKTWHITARGPKLAPKRYVERCRILEGDECEAIVLRGELVFD